MRRAPVIIALSLLISFGVAVFGVGWSMGPYGRGYTGTPIREWLFGSSVTSVALALVMLTPPFGRLVHAVDRRFHVRCRSCPCCW